MLIYPVFSTGIGDRYEWELFASFGPTCGFPFPSGLSDKSSSVSQLVGISRVLESFAISIVEARESKPCRVRLQPLSLNTRSLDPKRGAVVFQTRITWSFIWAVLLSSNSCSWAPWAKVLPSVSAKFLRSGRKPKKKVTQSDYTRLLQLSTSSVQPLTKNPPWSPF